MANIFGRAAANKKALEDAIKGMPASQKKIAPKVKAKAKAKTKKVVQEAAKPKVSTNFMGGAKPGGVKGETFEQYKKRTSK